MDEMTKQREQSQTQTQKEKEQVQSGNVTKKFNFSAPQIQNAEKLLRQPRSQEYLAIFELMDMLSSTDEEIIEQLKEHMDEDEAEEFEEMSDEEILEQIRSIFLEEFSQIEIEMSAILLGVLSRCYITGCDCHAITPEGRILEHFEIDKAMPEGLEHGRVAYNRYPGCKCVEVYTNCCRVIMDDGEVVELPNSVL